MFKTLSGKLFASYIVVTFIAIFVISLIFTNIFSGYIINTKEEDLTNKAVEISNVTTRYFNNKINAKEFSLLLNSFSNFVNAGIWVVDENGVIVASSGMKGHNFMMQGGMGMMKGIKLPESYVKIIMKGKKVKKIEKSPLYDMVMITVGVPIKLSDNVIVGSLFLHTPVTDIKSALEKTYAFLFFAAILSILLALIISLYLSRNISKPLKEMNKIALDMARGDYSAKINYKNHDEIGQLARSLNYLASESERLENMRRDFVANVSHELRTPLTAIRGFIEPLIDGIVTDKKTIDRYHGIIYDETLRLQRLINDLLDLSRLQAGKAGIDIKPFNLNEVIEKVVQKLTPQADKKGIKIINNCHAEINALGDEDRIQQILIIFIDNAIKYTDSGGKVEISVSDRRNEYLIGISDTGIGISNDDLVHIWDRFYKADKSRKMYGTGLGLAIAKEIVQLHGGSVSVKSQLGRGSTFQFTLKKANTMLKSSLML